MPTLVAKVGHVLWISLTALALAWALSFTPLYQRLDALALDTQTRLAAQQHFFRDALVIDIDDPSLRTLQPFFGSWPYKRDTYALLLDYLGEMGARTVVFDILFADPRDDDGRLREAIARNPNVVLASTARGESADSKQTATALHGLAWEAPAGLPASSWPAIQSPLPAFTQPASGYAGIGVVSVVADSDGILRRLPLFHQFSSQYVPSLFLAAHFAGGAHPPIRSGPAGSIQVGSFSWPADENGAVHLFYPRNPNSVLSMPFSRVAVAMLGLPNQELAPALLGFEVQWNGKPG